MNEDALKRFERLAAIARREAPPQVDVVDRVSATICTVRPATDPLVEPELAWFAALSLSLALVAAVVGWSGGSYDSLEPLQVWLQPFSSVVQQS